MHHGNQDSWEGSGRYPDENSESSHNFQMLSNKGRVSSILAVKCSILRVSTIIERTWWIVGGEVESQSLGMALFAAKRTKDIRFCDVLGRPVRGRPNMKCKGDKGTGWDSSACRSSWIFIQKGPMRGHSQKIWKREPTAPTHLQQNLERVGSRACNKSGVLWRYRYDIPVNVPFFP